MKRILLVLLVFSICIEFICLAYASEVNQSPHPWTNLNFPKDKFTFAIIPDLVGGYIGGFPEVVNELNLLRPDLVISVGDLYEGGGTVEEITKHAEEFDAMVNKLQMPFFNVGGNHDLYNYRIFGK